MEEVEVALHQLPSPPCARKPGLILVASQGAVGDLTETVVAILLAAAATSVSLLAVLLWRLGNAGSS